MALENARLYEAAETARAPLHDLFMQAPAAIAIGRGDEHRFELANGPYCRLFGGEALLGRPLREALPDLTGQGVYEAIERVYETGASIVASELSIRVGAGTGKRPPPERYFNVVYQPIRNLAGTIDGVATFAFDVSEQVVARRHVESLAADVARSEARLRALVSATAAIVWTAEPDGQVAEVSPSWLAFTGQSEQDYRDGGFLNAIHPDDRERSMVLWRSATSNGTAYAAEYRLQRVDGSYAHTLVRAMPVRGQDGSVLEYAGCNVDVTELRKAEVPRASTRKR